MADTLTIRDIRLTHGRYGPERAGPDLYPFDEVVIPFIVEGFRTDAGAVVRARMDFQVRDADGNLAVDSSESITNRLGLGGDLVTASVQLSMGEQTPPGEYTLRVRLTDEATGASAEFERALRLLPAEWAIVRPRFFLDPMRQLPAGGTLLAGQTLFFSIKVGGIDRDADRVAGRLSMQVLDESGREPVAPPVEHDLESTDREVIAHALTLDFQGELPLNRPGRFTLRLVADDLVGGRTATLDMPLRVELS